MLSLILITLGFILIIYKIIKHRDVSASKGFKELPSAPGGLPIFGHLFNIGSRPYEYFTDISDKIGPIYKIQIGWKQIIVLNNYDIINKCLQEDGANFAGRWGNAFSEQLAKYCGLILKEKEWWNVQRSFTLKVLKDFGFGKSQTETVLIRETEKLINLIKASNGEPIATADILSFATINVISDFIMKKEFMVSDTEMADQIINIRKLAQASEVNTILVNIFPIFKSFPYIEKKIFMILDGSKVNNTIENVYKYITGFINEHRDNFNPNEESQDLIDAFLLEQHKLKEQNSPENSFIDFQLIRLISELFIAGFETTSTSLTWAMLILSRFPNTQQKMHDEIVASIGDNRLPTMADKKSLHYFQAAMDEIFRFATLVPLSLPHRVLHDTSINGYFIPGNSVIFPNIYACHRDPKVWQKPNDFYPEHFLTDDGKYKPRPELIPFSIGKRSCLGESLAKMEYFIFLSAIIQKFKLSLDEVSERMNKFDLFQGTGGLISGSPKHKIIFKNIEVNE